MLGAAESVQWDYNADLLQLNPDTCDSQTSVKSSISSQHGRTAFLGNTSVACCDLHSMCVLSDRSSSSTADDCVMHGEVL